MTCFNFHKFVICIVFTVSDCIVFSCEIVYNFLQILLTLVVMIVHCVHSNVVCILLSISYEQFVVSCAVLYSIWLFRCGIVFSCADIEIMIARLYWCKHWVKLYIYLNCAVVSCANVYNRVSCVDVCLVLSCADVWIIVSCADVYIIFSCADVYFIFSCVDVNIVVNVLFMVK